MSVIDRASVEQAERLAQACMRAFPRLQPYAVGAARPGKPGAASPEEVDSSVDELLKQAAAAGYSASHGAEAVQGQVIDVQDPDGVVVGKAVVCAYEGAVLYVRMLGVSE